MRSFPILVLALFLAACSGGTGSAPPGFALSLSPRTLSLSQGGSESVTVTVHRSGGFEGEVALGVQGLPAGVGAAPVTVPAGASSATLTLTAAPGAAAGSWTLRVRGTSGTLSGDAELTLTVSAEGGQSRGPSSFDLIDEARLKGEIDAETALLYRVFATFGDTRLPAAYRGDDRGVRETHVMMEALGAYAALSEAAQAALEPFFIPPYYQDSWMYLESSRYAGGTPALHPQLRLLAGPPQAPVSNEWASVDSSPRVKVWYRTAHAEDRVKAERVAAEMDARIWPKLTGLMREPLSDGALQSRYNGGDGRLDIALADLSQTVPYNATLGSGGCGMKRTYLLVDREAAHLLPTVAHEFFHAITNAYDVKGVCNEYHWLAEASATWAEDFVYPQANSEHDYAPFFLATLHRPLETLQGVELAGNRGDREYGAYLFPFYLVNKPGRNARPGVVTAIWARTEATANSLEAVDGAVGGFAEVWPDFALYGWNRDRVDHYRRWDGLSAGAVPSEHVVSAPGTRRTELELEHLSARYTRVSFSGEGVRRVTLEHSFAGEASARVQALVKIGGAWQDAADWTATPKREFCRDRPEENVEEVVFVVSNSAWRNRQDVLRGELTVRASADGCSGWGGDFEATRTYRYGSTLMTLKAVGTAVFEEVEGLEGMFEATEGSVTVDYRQSGGDCVSTAGPVTVPIKASMGDQSGLHLEEGSNGAAVYWGYGGTYAQVTVTTTCPDGTFQDSATLPVTWFLAPSEGPNGGFPVRNGGTLLADRYVDDLSAGGASDRTVYEWRFSRTDLTP